jgi:N-acyl-D-amino-acid deacylase
MKNKLIIILVLVTASCKPATHFDIIIRHGMIYDGNGGEPYMGDLAINSDTIAAIGDLTKAVATSELDAMGMAVSPGFINMLSWANESLIEDGRSQGDIRQGVTMEIMGEGTSMGPLNKSMKENRERGEVDIKYNVEWTTLGEYLAYLEKRGISCNVASFVGAGTVRAYVIGEDLRPALPAETDSMRALVRQAMEEGALGVGSSLIYPPDYMASTEELVVLCREAAKYGGTYISHIRGEGSDLLKALEELITISREAGIPAEVYHLKAAGKENWYKMDSVIRRIEKARSEGLHITADMYTYLASATGLTICFPASLQDGGFGNLWKRLQDKSIRERIRKIKTIQNYKPENILFLGFKQDSLRKYIGKTLADISKIRGTSPEETAMDLIIQDSTRIEVAYFLMSEDNIRKQIVLSWVSFGSDEGSYAPEGVFLRSNPHPRAYGNFARVIGKYTRDEKLMSLQEAIYKLSKFPATNLKLLKRGELKPGFYADVLVFDPSKVNDHATYEKPHQYATGMTDVFVNGVQVLKDGGHTGAKPGRFVKGPGYKKNL